MKVVSCMIVLCLCVGSAQAVGLLAKKQLQEPSVGSPESQGLAPIPPQQFGKPLIREDLTDQLGHLDPNKAKAAKEKGSARKVLLRPASCTHPDCLGTVSLVEKPSGEQPSGEEGLAPIPPKQEPHINDHSTERVGRDARLGEVAEPAKGYNHGPKLVPVSGTHSDPRMDVDRAFQNAPAKRAVALLHQPSAADMARFDAEGPQQMAAAKAAGNCKNLVNPTNILRCQEELENEAHGVIGKAMAANKCGSLSQVEDINACLQLQHAKAHVVSAGTAALAQQPGKTLIWNTYTQHLELVSQQTDLELATEKKKDAILAKKEDENAAILAKIEDRADPADVARMKTPAVREWLAKGGGEITLYNTGKQ